MYVILYLNENKYFTKIQSYILDKVFHGLGSCDL